MNEETELALECITFLLEQAIERCTDELALHRHPLVRQRHLEAMAEAQAKLDFIELILSPPEEEGDENGDKGNNQGEHKANQRSCKSVE